MNWGQRILTMEADLVTLHELGHTMGAEHDDKTSYMCAPGQVTYLNIAINYIRYCLSKYIFI